VHLNFAEDYLFLAAISTSLGVCLHIWPDLYSDEHYFLLFLTSAMLIINVSLISSMERPQCFISGRIRGFLLPSSFVCNTSFQPQLGTLERVLCCSTNDANTAMLKHAPLQLFWQNTV